MKTALIVLFFFVIVCLGVTYVVSIENNQLKDIQEARLQYTCNCGWVNWDHAIPDGTEKLTNQVVNHEVISLLKDTVTYSQNMKASVAGLFKLVVRVERTYQFLKELSQEEREEVAYFILSETSESFEKMQGRKFWGLESAWNHSAFRDGDLMGDRISFYRALENRSRNEISSLCRPVSKDSSILVLKKMRHIQNKSWQPVYWLQEGKFPAQLNRIVISPQVSKKVRFLGESVDVYFESH